MARLFPNIHLEGRGINFLSKSRSKLVRGGGERNGGMGRASVKAPSGRVPSSLTRSEHGGLQNDHRDGGAVEEGKKEGTKSGPHQADWSGKCTRATIGKTVKFPDFYATKIGKFRCKLYTTLDDQIP